MPLANIKLAFEHRPALMPYFPLGYPDLDISLDVIEAIVEAGADLVELGLPFSDLLADGPVIQHATQVALQKLIYFIAPTSTLERIALVARRARLYLRRITHRDHRRERPPARQRYGLRRSRKGDGALSVGGGFRRLDAGAGSRHRPDGGWDHRRLCARSGREHWTRCRNGRCVGPIVARRNRAAAPRRPRLTVLRALLISI